jgi:hypothetical protein
MIYYQQRNKSPVLRRSLEFTMPERGQNSDAVDRRGGLGGGATKGDVHRDLSEGVCRSIMVRRTSVMRSDTAFWLSRRVLLVRYFLLDRVADRVVVSRSRQGHNEYEMGQHW